MSKATPAGTSGGAGITAVSASYVQFGSTLTPNGTEDTSQIQTALTNAGVQFVSSGTGQIVLLGSGTFKVGTFNAPLTVPSGVILRGAGAGTTIIQKQTYTNAGTTYSQAPLRTAGFIGDLNAVTINIHRPADLTGLNFDFWPIISVSPGGVGNSPGPDVVAGGISNLTVDGAQGATSVTVADGTKFTAGAFVLIDELSLPSWQPTPVGYPAPAVAGGNTVTISNASPAVVSWTGHGLAIDSKVSFTTTGTLPSPLVAGQTYFVIGGGFGANQFEISATSRGTPINTTTTGSGTHTAVVTPQVRAGDRAVYNMHNPYFPGQDDTTPPQFSNVTITNASPAVVTWTGSNFNAGNPVTFETTGTLPSPLVAGQTYYVIAAGLTANTFEISATIGGAAINTTSAGSGTHTGFVNGDCTQSGIFNLFCRGNLYANNNQFANNDTDGRPINEIKEIASVVGNVVTFTSPLSISYRIANTAQLVRYSASGSASGGNSVHVKFSGVEKLTVLQSGSGGIFFACAAYCWAKNVEISNVHGLGVAIDNCYRCELRDSYIHTSINPVPASDSYAWSPQRGSSELLIENNIAEDYCKAAGVFRSCGAGSVVAYNYTDNGFDWEGNYYSAGTHTAGDATDILFTEGQECGLNASHSVGCHHVLFEGNWSWNADSDYTHGNSTYITFFRNWLTGQRSKTPDPDDPQSTRGGGGAAWSWYMTYVGNVIGRSGLMSAWDYTNARMGCDVNGNNCVGFGAGGNDWGSIKDVWRIGYDPEHWGSNSDSLTQATLIRDGNYDFKTNSQRWHNTPATFAMPNSLYLSSKPAFFNTYLSANTWPPYDPSNGTTNNLPAKFRFDNGTPNSP